jgi:hypothetical protein
LTLRNRPSDKFLICQNNNIFPFIFSEIKIN